MEHPEISDADLALEYARLKQLGMAHRNVAIALLRIRAASRRVLGDDKATWQHRQRETSAIMNDVLLLLDALLSGSEEYIPRRLIDLDVALMDLVEGANSRLLVVSDLAERLGEQKTSRRAMNRLQADVAAIYHFMKGHFPGEPVAEQLATKLNKRFGSDRFKADTISRWPKVAQKNASMKSRCDLSLANMREAVAQNELPQRVLDRAIEVLPYWHLPQEVVIDVI